jgi:hypothetical protein
VATSSSILVSKQVLLENDCFNTNVSSGQDVELWTKIGITNLVAINNKSSVIYNFDLPNSLVKTPITKKTLMDFSQFAAAEKENKSLKKFLDIYRLEYALQFKIAGSFTQSQFYLNDITTKIPLKTRFLLKLPVSFFAAGSILPTFGFFCVPVYSPAAILSSVLSTNPNVRPLRTFLPAFLNF